MVNLYVIKDVKGNFNSAVMSFPNDDIAKRSVPFMVEQNETFRRYPEDFVVFRIGQFNYESGIIDPESTPVYICDLTFGKEGKVDA